MQKIIIIIGLVFCATTMFAQSACVTAFEKAIYAKYNDVFEGSKFSETHWQNNVTNEEDITKRMRDLDILANKLAEKLGLGSIPLKYLRDKDGNIVGYLKDENGNTVIIAGKYNSNSKQILVNKIYLQEASAEKMINVIAEEVYHVCQANEVVRLQNNEYRDEYLKLLNQYNTEKSDNIKRELKSELENLDNKQEIIKEWERNFKSSMYKELEEYYQTITNNPNLANNPELIRLQTRGKRESLETQYNNMSLEKDAKKFAETMGKVYKDKSNSAKK